MALRLAFIGNCQVAGLRASAQALLPEANISSVHIAAGRRSPEAIREMVRDSDFVVTGISETSRHHPLLGAGPLATLGPKTLFLPPFICPALHGDIIQFGGEPEAEGAVGHYHSLIAVASFALGLSAKRTKTLYNAHVFQALGYFEAAAAARVALIQAFIGHGYDLSPEFARWSEEEVPYMHATNHPSIVVLSSLATLALKRLGLIAQETCPPDGVADALANAIVQPVYPEIARRAGTAPRTSFVKRWSSGDIDRVVPLDAFVDRSYEIYRRLDRRRFDEAKITAASGKIAALISSASYPVPERRRASPSNI